MPNRFRTLEELPLYATDEELAKAICGKRTSAWRQFVLLHEGKGLPKINPVLGGRYTKAIDRFLDVHEGLAGSRTILSAPDGPEELHKWNLRRSGRPASNGAAVETDRKSPTGARAQTR